MLTVWGFQPHGEAVHRAAPLGFTTSVGSGMKPLAWRRKARSSGIAFAGGDLMLATPDAQGRLQRIMA